MHARFSEDELCAPSGSGGGLRKCNIVGAVLITVIENLFMNKAQFTSLSVKDSLRCSRKNTFFSLTILHMVQFFTYERHPLYWGTLINALFKIIRFYEASAPNHFYTVILPPPAGEPVELTVSVQSVSLDGAFVRVENQSFI